MNLKINEIYYSIQGESSYSGLPCSFVRLSGCPLRCRWCDTVYSYKKGLEYTFDKLFKELEGLDCQLVELTGGEPLCQEAVFPLMEKLRGKNYKVLLETSGAYCIKKVPKEVHIIMDLKCPDSLMVEKNLWSNLDYLKSSDELKFVIVPPSITSPLMAFLCRSICCTAILDLDTLSDLLMGNSAI